MLDWLFGSSEQKTEIPDWIKEPAREMLDRSLSLGKVGHMPWTGPHVAALDRAQVGAMKNNSAMAGAFGMDNTMPNIMPATDYGNGVWGYSAKPMYDQNLETLREERPGQMAFYDSHFVDPVTGGPGANMNQAQQGAAGPVTYEQKPFFEGNEYWSDQAIRQRGIDDMLNGHMGGMAGASVQPAVQGPQQPGQSGFLGFTGVGDMFDGGGPGQSGTHYQGLLSGKQRGEVGGLLGGIF